MIPLIIDCDPGIDDALALLLAAGSPRLDLRGVSTVAGNRPVDVTAANACRILDLAGRSDVPVYQGCARPLAYAEPRCNMVHGEDGLGGTVLPMRREPAVLHGADYLLQALRTAPPQTLTVVAMGPLTNLAMAEIKSPGVLKRARTLSIMGGAAFCRGNITPAAEFNFFADPLAAHVVMGAGADVRLFGLDVTSRAVMPSSWIRSLADLGTQCGAVANALLTVYAAEDPLLHDACPVAYLVEPELFSGQPCAVSVDWRPGPTEGQTLAWDRSRGDSPHAPNAIVYTDVQLAGLLELVRASLGRLP